MKRRSEAFSLVELLIAAAILTAAMIPLVVLFSHQNIQAHFTEQHLLARYRARRIADSFETLEYETLKAMVQTGGGEEAAGQGLPIFLPPLEEELEEMTGQSPLPEQLRHVRDKMGLQKEVASFTELEPGLGRLEVAITWRLPTDPASRKPRVFTYVRLLSRRDASLFCRHEMVHQE